MINDFIVNICNEKVMDGFMLVSMVYIYLKLYNIDLFINFKYDLILLEILYIIYIEVYWYKDKNIFNYVN